MVASLIGTSSTKPILSRAPSRLRWAPPRARIVGGRGWTMWSGRCAAMVRIRSWATVSVLVLDIGMAPSRNAAPCGAPTTRSPGLAGLALAGSLALRRVSTNASWPTEVERNVQVLQRCSTILRPPHDLGRFRPNADRRFLSGIGDGRIAPLQPIPDDVSDAAEHTTVNRPAQLNNSRPARTFAAISFGSTWIRSRRRV